MDQHHHFPPPLAGGGAAATISWPFLWQPKEAGGTTAAAAMEEELKQDFLRTNLELESTRLAAQEELRRMESQALHLTSLLEAATRERDEARHALLFLFHHADRRHLTPDPNPNLDPNSIQPLALDEGSDVAAAAAAATEDGEESSNGAFPLAMTAVEAAAAAKRGLPEKGRLVEAVMGAGPLLQTLLLAGPLPEWRHPPPELRPSEIPPVAINLSPKMEKDGGGSPTSLWNSSSSSSSPKRNRNGSFGCDKFQVVTLSLNNV